MPILLIGVYFLISHNGRKIIFLLIIFFTICTYGVASKIGKQQDEQFTLEQNLYNEANTLFNTGSFEEAVILTNELIVRYPNSEILNYLHASILSELEEHDMAKFFIEKTLELNPYLMEDPVFMLDFGTILKKGNYKTEALLVFEHCLQMDWNPSEYPTYKETITKYIEELTI